MSVADEISRLNSNISTLSSAKTAIASAITAKGGTVAQGDGLEDFASDIATIPSGSAYDIDDLIDGSITEIESDVTYIYAYCFRERTHLVSAKFPNVTILNDSIFYGCSALTNIYLPSVAYVYFYVFYGATQLQYVKLPKATHINSFAFQNCSNLKTAIFPTAYAFGGQVFSNCIVFSKLVLGGSTITPSLTYPNMFANTPFAVGSTGSGGVIYVPDDLITYYENDTNWSALNCEFKAIATTTFSGDGSTNTFTLTDNNAHPDEVFYIKIGNDFPEYTYNSTTGVITFATAPVSGTNNINVYFQGVETE